VKQCSVPRLEAVVAELRSAIRSLLQGDQEAAERSVDRVNEMMNRYGYATTSVPDFNSGSSVWTVEITRGGLAPWQLRRVTAHIDSQLNGSLTLRDLATIAGVSVYHFARAFRESLGETPHAYIMRRRVERAQGQMLTSDITLIRVAHNCGFADQSHFNKVFRSLVGESPGAWRRARIAPPVGGDIHG
jgi:AraC-like DNA-binding protein